MDTQQAHEKIYEYFTRPGAQLSFDAEGHCYYRHPEDPTVMCGVGILIPPDAYHEGIENTVIADLIVSPAMYGAGMIASALDGIDLEYLEAVQSAHDEAVTANEGLEGFLERLREVGHIYGLKTPVEQKIMEQKDVGIDTPQMVG